MNKIFLPNDLEKQQILIIQKYIRNEFALIRMTDTMLNKSIIDASFEIREILKSANIVDYSQLAKGIENKIVKKSLILHGADIKETNVSYYRPETKKGDPRFWVYNLKSMTTTNELIYFTIFENQLFAIPLTYCNDELEQILVNSFGRLDNKEDILNELITEVRHITNNGWVKSIRPNNKPAPKDAGETLESILGIKPNNSGAADYKGLIELKTKISKTTKNTLFCLVPDWETSLIKSTAEMVLKYGYDSHKYAEFKDLYITVNHKPNNQGLYLDIDDNNLLVLQNHQVNNEKITTTCNWKYNVLKDALLKKHPSTIWIYAEFKIENHITYFRYNTFELTKNPIFSQFLLLIQEGEITYDWRARVKKDGSRAKDKGNAFRISNRSRNQLFDATVKII